MDFKFLEYPVDEVNPEKFEAAISVFGSKDLLGLWNAKIRPVKKLSKVSGSHNNVIVLS